jgi:hypothetical protein
MKVKITKTKSKFSHVIGQEVGTSVIGELDSWASIALGRRVILKQGYYSYDTKTIYPELNVCLKITSIVSHNRFETEYSCYLVEEIS